MASPDFIKMLSYLNKLEAQYKSLDNVPKRKMQTLHRLSKKCYDNDKIEFSRYEFNIIERIDRGELSIQAAATMFSEDSKTQRTFVTRRLKAYRQGKYYVDDDKAERWEKRKDGTKDLLL